MAIVAVAGVMVVGELVPGIKKYLYVVATGIAALATWNTWKKG